MLNPTVEEPPEAPVLEQETPAPPATKPAKSKAKPKPGGTRQRPDETPAGSGTIYLRLSANGKYKELTEAELQIEAGNLLKDPTLRLIKGLQIVPQITFNTVQD